MRPSWGSPRVHVLPRREGWLVNHKRTEHLYRLEVLILMRNRPRRRKAVVTRKDEWWSMRLVALAQHFRPVRFPIHDPFYRLPLHNLALGTMLAEIARSNASHDDDCAVVDAGAF